MKTTRTSVRKSKHLLAHLVVSGFLLLGINGCASLATQNNLPSIPNDGIASPPRPYLFETPQTIRSYADRITMTCTIDPYRHYLGRQAWVVAVPAGEVKTIYHGITLRDRLTGEETQISDAAEIDRLMTSTELKQSFLVRDMGVWRHTRLMAITIEPSIRILYKNRNMTVSGFKAELTFPPCVPEEINDSAFSEKQTNLRQFLESVVANPEMLDVYAQAIPVKFNTEEIWQPRPELSPQIGWLKIPITEDGLYSIDGRWLAENGIDPESVAPEELIIVSRGNEISTIRVGPEDAGFKSGARLIFFGRRNDSRETNEHIYFIGKRSKENDQPTFLEAEPSSGVFPLIESFDRLVRIEEKNILKTRLGNFLSVREMDWVWRKLERGKTETFTFECPGLPNPVPSAQAKLIFYLAAKTTSKPVGVTAIFNNHIISEDEQLILSGDTLFFKIPSDTLLHGTNKLELKLDYTTESSSRLFPDIYLDALELEYQSLIRPTNGKLVANFFHDESLEGDKMLQAVGFRPYRLLAVDISNPRKPKRLPVSHMEDSSLIDASIQRGTNIIFQEDDSVPRAPKGIRPAWQDLQSMEYSADTIIIYHPSFSEQANALKLNLEENDQQTLLVDINTIYDAYGMGELSTHAIQDFLKDAVYRWKGRRPENVILIGDCTSDGQRISKNDVINYVPTYVVPKTISLTSDEYSTDQFFAWLSEEDELADLFVGRLSVSTKEDADELVHKIHTYRNTKASPWNQKYLFVADPGEFQDATHNLLEAVPQTNSDISLIETPSYVWEDNFYLPKEYMESREIKVSPVVTNMIKDAWSDGQGIITYFGHGSPNIWSNQRIWFGGDSENSDNLLLTNDTHLPFILAFTCNNGAIDYPMPKWNICISEDMMRVKNGGAIGGFFPTGPGFSSHHVRLAEGAFIALNKLHQNSFGQISEMARLNYQALFGDTDHSRMYILLGDPTLRIPQSKDSFVFHANSENKFDIQVTSSEDSITTASVRQKSYTGTIIHEDLLINKPSHNNQLSPPFILNDEVDSAQLLAYGYDQFNQYHQSIHLTTQPKQPVCINEVQHNNSTKITTYFIENQSTDNFEGEILITKEGDKNQQNPLSIPVSIPPHQVFSLPVDLSHMGTGVFRARITSSVSDRPILLQSDTVIRNCIIQESSSDTSHLIIPEQDLCILPSNGRKGSPLIELYIANQGPISPQCEINWNLSADTLNFSGSKLLGRLQKDSVSRELIPVELPIEVTTPIQLSLRLSSTTGEDNNDASIQFSIIPKYLPDLAIVPDSINIKPQHLTEGATIFVEGSVINNGSVASLPCSVELFPEDSNDYLVPLRSLADHPNETIPMLLPNEVATFKLRWDPPKSTKFESINVYVDGKQSIVESDRQNNIHRVPITINSTWDLSAEGIQIQPSQPGFLKLIARIHNSGGTDAKKVVVKFYKTDIQSTDNLIAELLVDRISKQSTIDVSYEWDITNMDMDQWLKPSFSINLLGSLQRISSVSN